MDKYAQLIEKVEKVVDDFTIHDYTDAEEVFPEGVDVQIITKKAAQINNIWFPLSRLAVDPDNELYIPNWLLEKKDLR